MPVSTCARAKAITIQKTMAEAPDRAKTPRITMRGAISSKKSEA
jgi:hypothetical protein